MGLIFMLHALDLVTFSLNKIVGSLFHSLVTDGMNQAKKICLFPSECPGQFFFYHDPAMAKTVNFCKLTNNVMEYLL